MLPGKRYSPNEILRILRAGKWYILVPVAIGLVIAPAVVTRIPRLYRSETLIMVVPQRVPDSYVKSTVTAKVEDRLPSIRDQILSRSRLERIIQDFDLYTAERQRLPMEDIVAAMRSAVTFAFDPASNESFRVAYESNNAVTAQKVTERLASLLIEENLRDRETLAESTNAFLETQLEDAKRRLVEHEQKLETYRRSHAGELPSQLEGNLQAIQSLQMQLQSSAEAINRAQERRILLERQIADAQIPPPPVAATVAGGSQPTNPNEPPVPVSTAQQLETAQARLDAFRLRYTADHPDVRTLERTIRELEQKLKDEESRRPATAPPARERPQSPAELARQNAEAARVKRLRDLQSDMEILDRQLASHASEQERLKLQIGSYQRKVDAVPTRESDLVELTRDYGTLQAAYTSLLTKREDSQIAANLERRQIGEQFRILDPAALPARPYNQRERIIAAAAGPLAGFVLGVLIIGLLEFRDGSFRREEDVVRALNLPVLALVPWTPSIDERRALSRRALTVNAAGTMFLIGCAAVLLFWRLQS